MARLQRLGLVVGVPTMADSLEDAQYATTRILSRLMEVTGPVAKSKLNEAE